jgi:hypothetical protein
MYSSAYPTFDMDPVVLHDMGFNCRFLTLSKILLLNEIANTLDHCSLYSTSHSEQAYLL